MEPFKVGAYHAKTHLAQLLDRVESGETLVITRHGNPVALLTPAVESTDLTLDAAVQELREFRDGHPLGTDLTIKQLVREGRRS